MIDYRKCNGCGICAESCRFEAIDMLMPLAAEGQDRPLPAKVVVYVWACPKDAITLKDHLSGHGSSQIHLLAPSSPG